MEFDWPYLLSLFQTQDFWEASLLVVELSVATWLGGIIFGMVLALAKQAHYRPLSWLAGWQLYLAVPQPALAGTDYLHL